MKQRALQDRPEDISGVEIGYKEGPKLFSVSLAGDGKTDRQNLAFKHTKAEARECQGNAMRHFGVPGWSTSEAARFDG